MLAAGDCDNTQDNYHIKQIFTQMWCTQWWNCNLNSLTWKNNTQHAIHHRHLTRRSCPWCLIKFTSQPQYRQRYLCYPSTTQPSPPLPPHTVTIPSSIKYILTSTGHLSSTYNNNCQTHFACKQWTKKWIDFTWRIDSYQLKSYVRILQSILVYQHPISFIDDNTVISKEWRNWNQRWFAIISTTSQSAGPSLTTTVLISVTYEVIEVSQF